VVAQATDGDGDYAPHDELRVPIPIRIEGEPVCNSDEVNALENDRPRGKGEDVEESALEEVRILFHHLQEQPDPVVLGFVGYGMGR
jgi:hypothetical protein